MTLKNERKGFMMMTPIEKERTDKDHTKTKDAVIICACNRELTLEELSSIYSEQSKKRVAIFIKSINETMQKYGIDTCMRKAHFLAQIGHESGRLQFTAEVLKKNQNENDVYDGYKGRGLIQLTYKKSYVDYGNYLGIDLTGNNKVKLESPGLATDSAGWFWTLAKSTNINSLADANDFIAITLKINGGLNGYNDRLLILQKAARTIGLDVCKTLQPLREYLPDVADTALSTKEYSIVDSSEYPNARSCFAWGYWHDNSKKTSGTNKDNKNAVIGYSRFLKLTENKPYTKRAFGLAPEQMVDIANNYIKENEKKIK